MKAIILGTLLFIGFSSNAQIKTVTSFMIGNFDDKEWEKIDFTSDGDHKNIKYSYSAKPNGVNLKILGSKFIGNIKVLIVQIPGSSKTYFINPDKKNKRIQFASSDRKYNKWLPWHYEGPINGIGTFCSQCAETTDEIFEIVNSFIN